MSLKKKRENASSVLLETRMSEMSEHKTPAIKKAMSPFEVRNFDKGLFSLDASRETLHKADVSRCGSLC